MGTNLCAGATRLSKYYAGAGIIPYGTVGYPYGTPTPVPITGPLALSNFYGAAFDAGMIINGNFANNVNILEDSQKFGFLGWVIFKRTVRLNGNSYIFNCLTPPTTTPIPAPPGGATSPGDNVTFSSDIANNPGYGYRILDTSTVLYSPLAKAGSSEKFVLELTNKATFAGTVNLSNPNVYGIMRGPVMVSEFSFELQLGDVISFNWRAAKDPAGDQYAVYIYLVKTATCEEITLLDVYGTNSGGWQTVSRTIVSGDPIGNFKFVVVHGSYDSTGGMKVGAYLYLHDIKVT
jgi:hypothetical protein